MPGKADEEIQVCTFFSIFNFINGSSTFVNRICGAQTAGNETFEYIHSVPRTFNTTGCSLEHMSRNLGKNRLFMKIDIDDDPPIPQSAREVYTPKPHLPILRKEKRLNQSPV
jgi:hypothetical protein